MTNQKIEIFLPKLPFNITNAKAFIRAFNQEFLSAGMHNWDEFLSDDCQWVAPHQTHKGKFAITAALNTLRHKQLHLLVSTSLIDFSDAQLIVGIHSEWQHNSLGTWKRSKGLALLQFKPTGQLRKIHSGIENKNIENAERILGHVKRLN